ncbi:MAG: hypothetical protein ACTHJT_17540 [Cytophaga sp.]|uniref:hypothetical protein n=1 Tax=Cytophaga sp. TaxID=29535 RepID=UPI003F800754
MIYLFLTVLCTSALFILFRVYNNLKINIFQTIVWNYVVCTLTGIAYQYDLLSQALYTKHMNTVIASSMVGSCFLPIFFLIGTSTRLAGLTPTTMANKLSMIIPAGFAILIGLAPFTWLQFGAIVIGILAVFFSSQNQNGTQDTVARPYLPWLVFITAGLLDLAIMYVNNKIATEESAGLFSIHTFAAAASWGLLALTTLLVLKKDTFQGKAILSGIVLGIPNYFSVYFLLKTLNYFHHDGSFVFPALNLSIILFTAVFSLIVFREKFSSRLTIGLLLAISSILLLYLNKA